MLALVSQLRGDLDWIVMRCLEKDRTRRYETANALAMDVRCHLENKPVAAGPPSHVYRMQKLIRRNKTVLIASGAVIVALFIGLGVSTWLWLPDRKAHAQLLVAEEEARASEAQMREMLRFFRNAPNLRTRSVVWTNEIPQVVPPGDSRLNGRTYEQLAAAWWKWALEMPVTNFSGAIHTWIDSSRFDVTASQSSNLWFVGSPFLSSSNAPPTVRHCRIPYGKEVFLALLSVESSNIESRPFLGKTGDDQAAIAHYWAEHIVDLFFEIDGVRLSNLEPFRVQSPQIRITAPNPWILGKAGGAGTSSGNGYFVLLSSLTPGPHVLRYGGRYRFFKPQDPLEMPPPEINMTYYITVTEPRVTPPQATASK